MAVVYYKPMEVQQANTTTDTDGNIIPQDYVPKDGVADVIAAFESAVAEAAEGDSDADADADADADNG